MSIFTSVAALRRTKRWLIIRRKIGVWEARWHFPSPVSPLLSCMAMLAYIQDWNQLRHRRSCLAVRLGRKVIDGRKLQEISELTNEVKKKHI
jgi:hypothetical protein